MSLPFSSPRTPSGPQPCPLFSPWFVAFSWSSHRSLVSAGNGGERGLGAIPFATVGRMHFFKLGVGQSTVMRVPAVLPVTSAMGLPTPTLTKLGGQSLKSKVPL